VISIKQTETFRQWERKLRDQKARALIAARILRVSNGLLGDVSPVGAGVSELRIHYGPGYRVYFHRRGAEIILLLCGGDKSTQDKDIQMAIRLATEWSDPNG
jgi:putative addiction module killer protein